MSSTRRPLTPFVFSASEGPLGSSGIPADSGAYISNAIPPGGDDNYVDFTSYSDGTNPYSPRPTTQRSASNPPETSSSSQGEESQGNAFRQEKVSAFLRTKEWIWAQRLGSSPKISPRRPGVTFEESPVIHTIPPPLSDAFTEEPGEIQVEIIPPSPSGVCTGESGEVSAVKVAPLFPPGTCTAPSEDIFGIHTL